MSGHNIAWSEAKRLTETWGKGTGEQKAFRKAMGFADYASAWLQDGQLCYVGVGEAAVTLQMPLDELRAIGVSIPIEDFPSRPRSWWKESGQWSEAKDGYTYSIQAFIKRVLEEAA